MSYWVKFHLDLLPCLEGKLGSDGDPWVGFKTCLPKASGLFSLVYYDSGEFN